MAEDPLPPNKPAPDSLEPLPRKSTPPKVNQTWWIHVDMTAICMILALLVIGYGILSYAYYVNEKNTAAAEQAKKEREDKEKLEDAKREARDAKWRMDAEKQRERIAEERRVRAVEAAARQARAEYEIMRLGLERQNAEERAARLRAQDEAARKREAEEAERKAAELAKQQTDAAKQAEIAQAKVAIASANREIEESNRKMDAVTSRMIASKNNMEYALKQSEDINNTILNLSQSQGYVRGGSGSAMSANMTNEIEQSSAKHRSISMDFQRSADAYRHAQDEKMRMEAASADAKTRRDQALATLKGYGVDALSAAPPPPARTPPPQQAIKVYVMKDGRRILALKAIEAGDTISIKTPANSFESINKADLDRIEDK